MAEQSAPKRKLIEVALPLEAINRESAREKSIRHGHPSTLHLWWARRPLAAARAVLFAQLVDDPSSRPDEFPTEAMQREERDRLHKLMERLVAWDSVRDESLLAEANAEILKSTHGSPPPILDPFAGGGTIPLEAQRLGLEAIASDLNPVAVLINKALIEIPPKCRNKAPLFPGLAESEIRDWKNVEGLAADVRAYGAWVRDEAKARLGHLYPNTMFPDGTESPVVAWIWARTVICPNPGCSAEVPLLSTLDLSTNKQDKAWLRPVITNGRVDFEIASGQRSAEANKRGQGARFECWVCGGPVTPSVVHDQLDVKHKPPSRLLAVVSIRNRRRVYSRPTVADEHAAASAAAAAARIRSEDTVLNAECRGTFGGNAQGKRYGFFTFADYFSDRQLLTLTTFCELILAAKAKILQDGSDEEYANAVTTYLGLCASKMSVFHCLLARWRADADKTAPAFGRQAIAMVWDFAEPMPFAGAGGDWTGVIDGAAKTLEALRPASLGRATQVAAQVLEFPRNTVVATDPPYYDNICYSDLSDFFYVWLRHSLREIYPELLATMLVPKADELVANAYRLGGEDKAKVFFEEGFKEVFEHARTGASGAYPYTVFYAFKQSESNDVGQSSTGWETLLEGMIQGGWEITSTWPMRTEGATRLVARSTNALASSIVLSLRPRSPDAQTIDRRGFIAELESQLPGALRKLQQGQIAPVDLPQAAIGPGMAVFSRYGAVLEADGTKMSVRSALARINEILDRVLNEQEGDFDSTSRFALAWYRQHGYSQGKFGDADNLARARNTSVDAMNRDGIIHARAGVVELAKPSNLSETYDPTADPHISNWEILHHLIRVLEGHGIAPAGDFLRAALSRSDGLVDSDLVKELAHLLFRIAEGNGWTKDALNFNNLVTSWPEIYDAAHAEGATTASFQGALEFSDED